MEKSKLEDIGGFYTRKVVLKKVKVDFPQIAGIHKRFFWPCVFLPDLCVGDYEDSYENQKYKITAQIKNIGGGTSNETFVYCNVISEVEHPGMNEIRYQEVDYLNAIPPGGEQTVNFEFELVKLHAREVSIIELLVDPKNFVRECRELNNTARWSWPS